MKEKQYKDDMGRPVGRSDRSEEVVYLEQRCNPRGESQKL